MRLPNIIVFNFLGVSFKLSASLRMTVKQTLPNGRVKSFSFDKMHQYDAARLCEMITFNASNDAEAAEQLALWEASEFTPTDATQDPTDEEIAEAKAAVDLDDDAEGDDD